jgi:hypothetical protein
MAAASQIFFPKERTVYKKKSGIGIPEINQKDLVTYGTGYFCNFICGPGHYVRRFLHRENDAVKNCSFKTDYKKIFKYVSGSYF